MKKAKILVPAIAALVLSSAAAVTGTVAWFTANLTATTVTDNITVVKTGSKMQINVAPVFGCSVDGEAPNQKVHHSALVDGSVNLADGTVYGPVFDKTGKNVTGFAVAEGGLAVAGGTQFRASKFTVTLSMEMGNEAKGQKYGVFIDPAALAKKVDNPDSTDKLALRVGFKAGAKFAIWAPYSDEALKYVDSTTGSGDLHASTATYSTDKQILSTDTTTELTYNTASKFYLGDIVKPGSEGGNKWLGSLAIDVYTWFEGAVIDNDSTITQNLGYTAAFNAVKDPSTKI